MPQTASAAVTVPPFSTQWSASTESPAFLLPVRIETKRIANHICIRVFPDQPFLDSHQEPLTEAERDAGTPLRDLIRDNDLNDPALADAQVMINARGQWLELARRYGVERAAWILTKLAEDGDAAIAISPTEVIPRLFLLPERFVFLLYQDGQVAYAVAGGIIQDNPRLLPLRSGQRSDDPPPEGIFDAGSKWMANFGEAVTIGLAAKIPLRPEHVLLPQLHFDEIVVVGLRAGGAAQGLLALQNFVNVHKYTDGGLEFLLYGTPTNNTDEGASGHSQSEEQLAAAFDFVVLDPLASLNSDWRDQSVSGALYRAVGLNEQTQALNHIKGAERTIEASLPAVLSALWPATADYFLSEMLEFQDQKHVNLRALLQAYAIRFLRPRGALAAMRIGNLPYGVLPVTRIRSRSATDSTGWASSSKDHPPSRTNEWTVFDEILFGVLETLLPHWLARARDSSVVPQAGSSGDADEELVKLMGMQPHSVSFRVRPVVGQEMIGILLQLLWGRFSGYESSFGGYASSEGALAAWVFEKQQVSSTTYQILRTMGADQSIQSSKLFNAFSWGSGEPLYMPLVRGPDPAHGPEDYFATLLQQGAAPSPNASPTLFYDMLRRSLERNTVAPSVFGSVRGSIVRLSEFPVLEFFGRKLTAKSLADLAAREPAIDIDAVALAASLNQQQITQTNDVIAITGQAVFGNFASKLQEGCSPRYESGLVDVIDASTRLDAWYSTFALRRLETMQARATTPGIHWGAYGYVEDVIFPLASAATGQPASEGGFIHAPSIGQATAAALHRSAFDSHRTDGANNAYAADLTSTRVRTARTVIDEVRQGQELAALAGNLIESELGKRGLDRIKDDLRAIFPYSAHDESDDEAPDEFTPLRNVVDGRALLSGFATTPPFKDHPELRTALAALGAVDEKAVRSVFEEAADAVDAVGDVLMYESVFQATRGNYERSGAALDACAGFGRPPEIESMTTPIRGINLRQRVCLALPCAVPSGADSTGARAAADPRFNAWAGTIIGSLANIGFHVGLAAGNPAYSATLDLRLDEITPALSALDFLFACAALPDGTSDTEIEVRIRRHVRSSPDTPASATISIDGSRVPAGLNALDDAMELGRMVLELLGHASLLTPATLTHPDDPEPNPLSPSFYSVTEIAAIRGRAQSSYNTLSAFEGSLAPGATNDLIRVLDECAEYGIKEALTEFVDAAALEERRARVLPIVSKRLAAAGPLLGAASADTEASLPILSKTFKALLGDAFWIFPTFDASPADDKAAVFGAMANYPSTDRVWLWLQQVADTHPRVRTLERFLMGARAWGADPPGAESFFELRVAQLPQSDAVGWQALSDTELGTTTRTPGCVSIVSMLPRDFTLGCVTGLVVDEWTETMADRWITMGISFECNQPGAQAPHVCLMPVPGNFDDPAWTPDHMADIVRDTMELARARLVDLDALPPVAGIVPALLFPISNLQPTLKLPAAVIRLPGEAGTLEEVRP